MSLTLERIEQVDEHTDENSEETSAIVSEFEPIYTAVLERQASKFALGDLIGEICGKPSKNGVNNGSAQKIKEAADFLQERGIEYTAKYLTEIRDISATFHVSKAPKRLGGVAWSVHREFRPYPELLGRAVKKTPDLVLTVAKAKEIVDKYKAEKQKREDNKKAKDAPEENTIETVGGTTADLVESTVESPTADDHTKQLDTTVAADPVSTSEPIIATPPESVAEDWEKIPLMTFKSAVKNMLEQCQIVDECVRSGNNTISWEGVVVDGLEQVLEAVEELRDTVKNSIALIEENDKVETPLTRNVTLLRKEAGGNAATV